MIERSSDTSPAPPEAALAIPVPEAEPLVGRFRERYDPSAAAGVPAHITINYPFTPHFSQPDAAHPVLEAFFAGVRAFLFSLTEVRTFPTVLYLAPEPADLFADLIRRVVGFFPDSPPYGGRFSSVIPHLTVAHSDDARVLHDVLVEFTPHARRHLPIACTATQVLLLDNVGGHWEVRQRYDLPIV